MAKRRPKGGLRSWNLRNVNRVAPRTRTREVGTSKRYLGVELSESVAAGLSKINQNPANYIPPTLTERVKQAQDKTLLKDPRFLDALKRRLQGETVGGTIRTIEDRRRFDQLQRMQEALTRKRVKDARQELRNATTIAKKATSLLKLFGIKVVGVFDSATEKLKALSTSNIAAKLAGLGMRTPKNLPKSGSTPYLGRSMLAVSSSNVKQVGWEPHDPREARTPESRGTLFIEFHNDWLYKYANAPFWLFQRILKAPSKGRAVWALIRRGLYPDGIPYGTIAREGYERIR